MLHQLDDKLPTLQHQLFTLASDAAGNLVVA
jgi:hypothetical protein